MTTRVRFSWGKPSPIIWPSPSNFAEVAEGQCLQAAWQLYPVQALIEESWWFFWNGCRIKRFKKHLCLTCVNPVQWFRHHISYLTGFRFLFTLYVSSRNLRSVGLLWRLRCPKCTPLRSSQHFIAYCIIQTCICIYIYPGNARVSKGYVAKTVSPSMLSVLCSHACLGPDARPVPWFSVVSMAVCLYPCLALACCTFT